MTHLGTWAASLPAKMIRRMIGLRRLAAAMLLTGVASIVITQAANSQDRREYDRYRNDSRDYRTSNRPPITRAVYEPPTEAPSREEIDDILKSLTETERRSRELSYPDDRRYDDRRPINTQPQNLTRPTREMEAARRVLPQVSREADRLTSLLSEDMRRVSGIRPYFDDLLRMRARVAIISQRAQQYNDHNEIHNDLKGLDKDWRLLAYRLSQLSGLSRNTIQQIRTINDYAKEVGKVFEIAPQLDRRALMSQTASLASGVHNLMEDIEVELPRSQQKQNLLLEGRRIQQQAEICYDSVADQEEYRLVLDEYRMFQQMWFPFATKLRPLNNRYLERDVRRINELDHQMHELLWMPHQMDRERLIYISSLLQRDVDDFFVRAPLKLLIELPRADQVLAISDEFYGTCEHFNDVVSRNESTERVVEAYQYVDDAWQSFSGLFRDLKSQAAQQVLSEIEQNIEALATALRFETGSSSGNYNYDRAIEAISTLDNLAYHLESDIGRWLSTSRETFRNQAMQDASTLTQRTRRIHEMLIAGADRPDVIREITELDRDWRAVAQWINRCNTVDRPHLDRLANRISPAVAELRTLL
ncbi:hypothetical protein [Thalassoroseus pseudoceratinae]|uniref:hypothetical protein n=1 Tax=Thalassoroseus pseudoceratinae TaxID=2713176 RepID=UPI00142050FD|nr:hypothetical protein [Thalassoroseus pseudoceratinae]